jgi:hypothetical protein
MKLKNLLFLAIFITSCFNASIAQVNPWRIGPVQPKAALRTINASEWLTGAMPDTTGNGTPTTTNLKELVIPNASLQSLGVTLGGTNLIVCNNPERFTGDGWLFQHSHVNATQGGVNYPLSGTTKIYMFHLNFTSPAATKYIHLVVHNPGASAVTYSSKGRHYTNVDFPLSGAATGQSYNVSKDWLANSLATASGSINANAKLVVFTKQVNSANMFDALYEITTSGPVYYYTVVTSTGTAADARTAASVGAPYASFAIPPDPRVTQSDYRMETGGAYARGAAVFPASDVSSDNVLVIPNVPSRIGFCFNTSNKFYPMLEKQNPAVVVKTPPVTDTVRSIYSSSHNYGNYGMKYNTVFHLQNNSSTTKTVNIYFAENENLVDAASGSARWNSRFKVDGVASAAYDTYIQGNNPRKLLKTVTVPTGTTDFTVEVYIPGLITTNHQLIFETTTTVPSTLPVLLTSFTGQAKGLLNEISWVVEQEDNLLQYELERKNDGGNFMVIQTIKARNNPITQQYSYKDEDVRSTDTKNYYRLKMVNTDGSSKYSNIIVINSQAKSNLQVLGNPFINKIDIQFKAEQGQLVQIALLDATGKRLQSATDIGSGTNKIHTFNNLDHIKPGVYVVELIIDGIKNSLSVVKAN